MKLIKADHERLLEIPGVPGLVRRPVDIDKAKTGFANLRSLRIYRFDADSVINGHAEEDEVFVVVMAGSIDLTLSDDDAGTFSRRFELAELGNANGRACVAYMPPGSAYRLVAQTDANVAYARATLAGGRPFKVFTPHTGVDADGVTILLEETAYALRLRLRLLQINARHDDVSLAPIHETEANYEALLHVRTEPAERAATVSIPDAEPTMLGSWDTAAVAPRDQPTLVIAKGSSALVLIVLAV